MSEASDRKYQQQLADITDKKQHSYGRGVIQQNRFERPKHI
jgi:hypothetical protein